MPSKKPHGFAAFQSTTIIGLLVFIFFKIDESMWWLMMLTFYPVSTIWYLSIMKAFNDSE